MKIYILTLTEGIHQDTSEIAIVASSNKEQIEQICTELNKVLNESGIIKNIYNHKINWRTLKYPTIEELKAKCKYPEYLHIPTDWKGEYGVQEVDFI